MPPATSSSPPSPSLEKVGGKEGRKEGFGSDVLQRVLGVSREGQKVSNFVQWFPNQGGKEGGKEGKEAAVG
eukprot:CAMPEP_0201521726 /NCGR_PEP_ID=MMETSP0161_2-20130828/15829_1 /ASSEMBLY_ACC=CAM_ASM_000251 /TAXON_ID=180227 /ORGANISM="Neoparamoeba aestuarina, Strain SoJaBio B1-5/56/2" /LENGTH=70 /DNA_ID=CAMNT_0047920415 /DNA_START=306 /DNA_END=514 /DNA_ORIENTATION=-